MEKEPAEELIARSERMFCITCMAHVYHRSGLPNPEIGGLVWTCEGCGGQVNPLAVAERRDAEEAARLARGAAHRGMNDSAWRFGRTSRATPRGGSSHRGRPS